MGPYAALCAAFAVIIGMIFGYDQGVVSIVLVLAPVPRSSPSSLENLW